MDREKVIDLLYQEYQTASQRIEDYQNKHLSFFNGIVFVSVGVLSYMTKDNPDFAKYIFIFPYFLILLLLLMHYHYRRTLVVQGHRKVLEETINKLTNNTNPLLFSRLSEKYVFEPLNNWSVIFFSILVITGLFMSILFANKLSETDLHFYLQTVLLLIVFGFYIHSTFRIKRKSYRYSKKLLSNYFNQK